MHIRARKHTWGVPLHDYILQVQLNMMCTTDKKTSKRAGLQKANRHGRSCRWIQNCPQKCFTCYQVYTTSDFWFTVFRVFNTRKIWSASCVALAPVAEHGRVVERKVLAFRAPLARRLRLRFRLRQGGNGQPRRSLVGLGRRGRRNDASDHVGRRRFRLDHPRRLLVFALVHGLFD